jgi:hypothetical protein
MWLAALSSELENETILPTSDVRARKPTPFCYQCLEPDEEEAACWKADWRWCLVGKKVDIYRICVGLSGSMIVWRYFTAMYIAVHCCRASIPSSLIQHHSYRNQAMRPLSASTCSNVYSLYSSRTALVASPLFYPIYHGHPSRLGVSQATTTVP